MALGVSMKDSDDIGLVISRRYGESVYLAFGDEVAKVIVEKGKGQQVKLRIIADRKVHIIRDEIVERAARRAGR